MQKYPLTLPCLLSGDLPENWGEPPQLQATDEPWEGAPVEPKQPLTLYSPGKTPRALDGDRVTKLQCVYDQQRRVSKPLTAEGFFFFFWTQKNIHLTKVLKGSRNIASLCGIKLITKPRK